MSEHATHEPPRHASDAPATANEPTPMREQAFKDFVAHWPEIAYLKNDRLEHVYGNDRCCEAMGLSLAELEGTTARDFFPDELARTFEAADAKILGGASRVDVPDARVDLAGERRWIQDTKFPVVTASGERLIAGLGLDITDRVRAEQATAEHHAFEQLVAEIAARLTQVNVDGVQATIDDLLRSIGTFLGTERAFLFRLSDDWRIVAAPAMWTADGMSRDPALSDESLVDTYPWLIDQLRAGRVVNAGPGLSALPAEAASLRAALESAGVNSGVVVPVAVEGHCIGMLGVDTVLRPRDYSETIIDRLRLVADMIGSTLRRTKMEAELRDSLGQISRLKERLEQENLHLRDQIAVTHRPGGIVGESPVLQRVLAQTEQVAPSDTTVLITGETGTGKELVALAIHRLSGRSGRMMIKVNCAALPPTLIEGELFGREKGAFTGATTRQAGRFEVADGSTIFLDEIGDLPLELQAKLLHVLEDGEFARLGSNTMSKVDVRVIAATNRDLAAAVREGRFREDLFYRLNVFPIEVPPLRKRREDIIPLTWAFVDEFSRTMGKKIGRIPKATAEVLTRYDWPGNVRELRNVVERAMILARSEDLVVSVPGADGRRAAAELSLDAAQRRHIVEVLDRVNGRVAGPGGAAELLGLPRSTLRARMRKLGITAGTR